MSTHYSEWLKADGDIAGVGIGIVVARTRDRSRDFSLVAAAACLSWAKVLPGGWLHIIRAVWQNGSPPINQSIRGNCSGAAYESAQSPSRARGQKIDGSHTKGVTSTKEFMSYETQILRSRS